MNKLKTLILEDDPEALKALQRELANYKDIITVTSIAKSYEEAVKLKAEKFDLSILDKDLPEGYTCFHVIENSNISNFGIIALNSKNPQIPLYSLHLFKELPLYIIKPYTNKSVSDFIKLLTATKIKQTKITLHGGNSGKEYIDEDSILYIKSKGNYSEYYLSIPNNNRHKLTITGDLKAQEAHLKDYTNFVRVHNEYIVNKTKIVKTEKYNRTSGKLILEGGEEIFYSKDKNEIIDEILRTKI